MPAFAKRCVIICRIALAARVPLLEVPELHQQHRGLQSRRSGSCRRSSRGNTSARCRARAGSGASRPARRRSSRTCRRRRTRRGSWSGRTTGSRCRRCRRPAGRAGYSAPIACAASSITGRPCSRASAISGSMSAALAVQVHRHQRAHPAAGLAVVEPGPRAVRSPSRGTARTRSARRLKVTGSMSRNTGRAPTRAIVPPVAKNV